MKKWQIGLVGIGLYGLAMLMTIPATLVRKALPPEVEIEHIDGTIWQGQAEQIRYSGQAIFDYLAWDWKTSRLLTLSLVVDLKTRWQDAAGHTRLNAGFSSIRLQDADITLPLAPFVNAFPELAQYKLQGNLNALSPDFVWADGKGTGQLSADWRDARSGWSGDAIMGSYHIDVKAVEKGYALRVNTTKGPLMIDADATGSPGQGWNVGTTLKPPAAQMPEFMNLLAQLGPPREDGVYVLRYSFK